MTLREKAAIVSAVLIIVGTIWYICLALSGKKVKPVLAAWIVNCTATVLSFATYWTAPKHSFVSNAYNAISTLTVTSILVAAFIVMRREGKGPNFKPLQIKCMYASGMITIFWIVLVCGFRGTGIIPNLLTQVIMLIGYFVIGERIVTSGKNTESLISWWCIILASAAGMVTALISRDWLASIFAGRTFAGSLILVILMHRAEYLSRSVSTK